MSLYITSVVANGRSAKTCGLIAGKPRKGMEVYKVQADTAPQAAILLRDMVFGPREMRPMAGVSYLRAWSPRLFDRVAIVKGFPFFNEKTCSEDTAHYGTVTELLGDNMVSIHPDGYHNAFVDFGASEVAYAGRADQETKAEVSEMMK